MRKLWSSELNPSCHSRMISPVSVERGDEFLASGTLTASTTFNGFPFGFIWKGQKCCSCSPVTPLSRLQSLGTFVFHLKKFWREKTHTLNRKQVGGIWKTCHLLTCSCLNSANGNWFWHPRWQAYCSSDWEYASVQAARKNFPKWEDKFCILVKKTFSV